MNGTNQLLAQMEVEHRLIPPTTERGRELIEALDAHMRAQPPEVRIDFVTRHVLHAGLYARSIFVPAGVAFTSVLVKIPTLVIVSGHCTVLVDDNASYEIDGYSVMPALAGRKQAYVTHRDTEITMVFATGARTVQEAECEFTDETDQLMSRRAHNIVQITGV